MLKQIGLTGMLLSMAFAGGIQAAPLSASNAVTAQQEGICRGVVLDAQGEPIIGASVIIKGTTNGFITDLDGNFTLKGAQKGDVLEISYVGYNTQTVKWQGQKLNIVLQENDQIIDEVVVTGYGGHQKRGTLTTAISKVDNKVLKNAAFSNAGQALQGSVTGLRVTNTTGLPGSTPDIVLRGGATISGTAANALIIVDGIIREGMNDVNPEDIESMQILKDAASTAIYGARANGGVILIETKSGKQGHSQVNYNFKLGVNKARKGYEYVGTEEYLYYNRLGFRRTNEAIAGYNSSGYSIDGQAGFGTNAHLYDVRLYSDDTAYLVNEGWQVMDDPYYDGKQLIYKDHFGELDDAVFNNSAMTQEHYVNFSGGSDKGSFVASVGYYNEDGEVRNTGYERFTGNINGSYKVLPFLKVKAGAQFMWYEQTTLYMSNYNLFYRVRSQRPTWNPYLEDGTPAPGEGSTDGNPLYWSSKYHSGNGTTKLTFYGGFTADIIKDHLILDGNASWYSKEYNYDTAWDAYHTQNRSTGNFNTTNSLRNMYAAHNRKHQIQLNSTLTYKNVFNKDHDLNVMIGGEYFTYDYYNFEGGGNGAPTDDIHTLNVVSNRQTLTTSRSAYRILSAFGRAEYNYKMKYLLALTARYDGISRLADNRWGFFPGVSFGWNVTQEDFWQNSSLSNVISNLKPRISYGTNGNVNDLGNYEVYGTYGTTDNYNSSSAIVNSGLINTGLRWEESATFEAGLDISFFNNRLAFILDYYNRETKNLLTNLSLPNYTGFSSIRTNLGNIRNSGFEAEVRANIINKGGFTWDVTANISTVANKILKLPTNTNERNRQGGYEVADGTTGKTKWVSGYQEGGKLGEIVAYVQNHIYKDWDDVIANSNTTIDEVGKLYGPGLKDQINPETGKTYEKSSGWKPIEPGDVCWEDIDGDGKITSLDRKVIGNYLPNITGGFSTTFGYKGFSLYARFDYALGHTLYNDLMARTLGQYQGTFNLITEVRNMWSEDNTDTDLPKFYYADQLAKYNITRSNNASSTLDNNNSRFYGKGDYLACREITLSYSLPKKLIRKAYLQEASVYVTGQNLFYITGYDGVSPEPAVSGTNDLGVDSGRYPTPRTFLFGLSLTF